MALRKCSKSEAAQAAQLYGVADEHELKSHVLGKFNSVSNSDIYIDTKCGKIYICNKDGSNPQDIGIDIN